MRPIVFVKTGAQPDCLTQRMAYRRVSPILAPEKEAKPGTYQLALTPTEC
jgi:hypothetical protein